MNDTYDLTIIPNDFYNILPVNTYWYNNITTVLNNLIYYDTNQITNIQYHRIMEFLNEFM